MKSEDEEQDEEKKLVPLKKVSVVHLNADRGYISYLEEDEEGNYKLKAKVLDSENDKEQE
jgi:hypothetical protein